MRIIIELGNGKHLILEWGAILILVSIAAATCSTIALTAIRALARCG